MRADDVFFGGFMVFILGVVLFAFVLLSLGIYDSVKERQAFTAITQCEAHRGIPRRQSLTTNVVCIPDRVRQDTATVNLNVK